jgi:hypothetical protein
VKKTVRAKKPTAKPKPAATPPPPATPEPEEKPFDFGGLPLRDLKKNLGCG